MSFVTKVLRRGLSTSALRMAAIKHVTVIGGGQMGVGIAQVSLVFRSYLVLGPDPVCLLARPVRRRRRDCYAAPSGPDDNVTLLSTALA